MRPEPRRTQHVTGREVGARSVKLCPDDPHPPATQGAPSGAASLCQRIAPVSASSGVQRRESRRGTPVMIPVGDRGRPMTPRRELLPGSSDRGDHRVIHTIRRVAIERVVAAVLAADAHDRLPPDSNRLCAPAKSRSVRLVSWGWYDTAPCRLQVECEPRLGKAPSGGSCRSFRCPQDHRCSRSTAATTIAAHPARSRRRLRSVRTPCPGTSPVAHPRRAPLPGSRRCCCASPTPPRRSRRRPRGALDPACRPSTLGRARAPPPLPSAAATRTRSCRRRSRRGTPSPSRPRSEDTIWPA